MFSSGKSLNWWKNILQLYLQLCYLYNGTEDKTPNDSIYTLKNIYIYFGAGRTTNGKLTGWAILKDVELDAAKYKESISNELANHVLVCSWTEILATCISWYPLTLWWTICKSAHTQQPVLLLLQIFYALFKRKAQFCATQSVFAGRQPLRIIILLCNHHDESLALKHMDQWARAMSQYSERFLIIECVLDTRI